MKTMLRAGRVEDAAYRDSLTRDEERILSGHIDEQLAEIRKLKEELLLEKKGRKPTILVVDDEPRIVELIRVSLEDDFTVIVANSGNEALHKARYEQPDLITMDIMMPGMSGFEVVDELKKWDDTARIPVVFLSAKDQIKDMYKGILTGGEDYITKPFEPEDLVKRIRATLNEVEHS